MMRRRFIQIIGVTSLAWGLPARAADGALVGLTLPMTGAQADVGKELMQGYQLAIKNSSLGMLVLDDAGDAKKSAENALILAQNPKVFVASGIVGTPHAQASLPVFVKNGLPVVGLRSGVASLRNGQPGVYHLKSTFESELDMLAKQCAGAGHNKMAILYSKDSFGEGQRVHFAKALESLGIEVLPPIAVDRNGADADSAAQACADLVKKTSGYCGIAALLIVKPMTQCAKALRNKGIVVPIYAMSFTATTEIASKPANDLIGLGLVIVFPLQLHNVNKVSTRFRQACLDAGKPELIHSLTAYEGYFYASTILATRANTRAGVQAKMNAGVQVADIAIKPDRDLNGYSYLQIVHKSTNGLLRS